MGPRKLHPHPRVRADEDRLAHPRDEPGDAGLPGYVAGLAAVERRHDRDLPLGECDGARQAVVGMHEVIRAGNEPAPQVHGRAGVIRAALGAPDVEHVDLQPGALQVVDLLLHERAERRPRSGGPHVGADEDPHPDRTSSNSSS